MKTHLLYEIAFVGLKNGIHEFNYQIEDKFFLNYQEPEFSAAEINAKLLFDKKSTFFLLNFQIIGKVSVICDRCGQPFSLNLWDEFVQVVKLVDNPSEIQNNEDPEVTYISKTASHLNLADWIYEFILLSLPMQRIHPLDENGKSSCDPNVLALLDQLHGHENINIHPIWKDLDKFRNS